MALFFSIFKYSVRSESGRIIVIQDQSYYVPVLPNSLQIIYPQGICTSEGYKGTFIAHCHEYHHSYAKLNLNEDIPGCHKVKPLDMVHLNYEPKNNLPTHEDIIRNQREN